MRERAARVPARRRGRAVGPRLGGCMKRYANLMSDQALFRVSARASFRRWAPALAGLLAMLAPVAVWHWQQCQRIRHEHEALEASYAPIRRLNEMNMELRADAA